MNLIGLLGCLVALLCMACLTPGFVPGLIDAARQIEASVTKTSTYNGASMDLGSGFAPGGLGEALSAVVNITAIDLSSLNETYTFVLEESANNSDFTVCGPVVSATAVGSLAVPGWVSQRYIRVTATLGGTTPSVTYSTDFTVIDS